jgi:hypothetical protein
MKHQKEPSEDLSNQAPGGNFLPLFLTYSVKHPYMAMVLALVFFSLPYCPALTGKIIQELRHSSKASEYGQQEVNSEQSIGNPPVSTEIQGDFTSPSERNVPFTPKWGGPIKGLRASQDVFVAMVNRIGQLCMYQVQVDDDSWDLIHHLGNEFGDIGQEYKVWLFVPAPGAHVQDGLQLFLPAGHRVSPIKRYTRRANLPGEK